MKYKEHPKIEQESPPELDDGWWEAILADEEKFPSAKTKSDGRAVLPRGEEGFPETGVPWDSIAAMQEKESAVDCEVVGFNRGGLLVDGEGFHGFVPVSHLVENTSRLGEVERETLLADYVGEWLTLKVIECDPMRGRVVLSERAAQTAPGARQALFSSLTIGETVMGEVTNVTDFGIFIDLGGVEGLVHISELSWGRVSHPSDMALLGEEMEVVVLNIDGNRGRVALSRKRLFQNPWETAAERYEIGAMKEVTITDVVSFGAFARLEEGLEGLIHVSEMGADRHVDPRYLLEEGQRVQVRVLHVDPARQRMSLRLVDNREAKSPIADEGVDG